MKQSTLFLRGEADRYYKRNFHKSRENDPVLNALRAEQLRPRSVLEIGCGDGWRLVKMRAEMGSICYGIDPSKLAINDAPQKDGIKCWRGTAENLKGVTDSSVEMVIHAFELYLIDREDLFRVVC